MNFLSRQKQRKRVLARFVAVSMLLFLIVFTVGCSSTSYDTPAGVTGGSQISSLLSPQQLKAWIDNGYRDERGYKVVILDSSSAAAYTNAPGHIPGSYNASYPFKVRSEGPMMVPLMVPDGPQMDAFVQKYGIDGNNTVVVFTGNGMTGSTRNYWTFRYWGFPQNRLFVLNGKATTDKSVWKEAGYELVTGPSPTAPGDLGNGSTFSVSSWPGNMDQVRATLADMVTVSKMTNTATSLIVDTRAEAEWQGLLFTSVSTSQAFVYQFRNSVFRPYELEFEGTDPNDTYANISTAASGTQRLKSEAQLLAEWTAAGMTKDKKLYFT